jgi:hypothetical protein
MAPVSAAFLAVPFVSGGGLADNFVRAADGAGGGGRFIPPGSGGGFTPPGGSGGSGFGFTDEELIYVDRALKGDFDDLLDNIECHGASLCRSRTVGGFYMMPVLDERTGKYVLEADPKFEFKGFLGKDIQPGNLKSGDLLTYHDSNLTGVFGNRAGPINVPPAHSNRFLGISDEGLIFFDKANLSYPFTTTTLDRILGLWRPEFTAIYRPR